MSFDTALLVEKPSLCPFIPLPFLPFHTFFVPNLKHLWAILFAHNFIMKTFPSKLPGVFSLIHILRVARMLHNHRFLKCHNTPSHNSLGRKLTALDNGTVGFGLVTSGTVCGDASQMSWPTARRSTSAGAPDRSSLAKETAGTVTLLSSLMESLAEIHLSAFERRLLPNQGPWSHCLPSLPPHTSYYWH